MKSEIHVSEMVDNQERKFGSTLHYYPATIVYDDMTRPALFTRHQLEEAIERAASNPEDIPEKTNWLQRIFG